MTGLGLDRNGIIAIALCVVGFFLYESYLNDKYPDRFKPQVEERQSGSEESVQRGPALAGGGEQLQESEESSSPGSSAVSGIEWFSDADLMVENDECRFFFDQSTGGLKQVEFRNLLADDKKSPLRVLTGGLGFAPGVFGLKFDGPFNVRKSRSGLVFSRQVDDWLVEHWFDIPEKGYGLAVKVTWKNLASVARHLVTEVQMTRMFSPKPSAPAGFFGGIPKAKPSLLVGTSKSYDWYEMEEHCASVAQFVSTDGQAVEVFGFDNHYFTTLFVPAGKNMRLNGASAGKNQFGGGQVTCPIQLAASVDQGHLAANASVSASYKSWIGPKDISSMKEFDPVLEQAVDLGFAGSIARVLLVILKTVHDYVGNWGYAIIIFTIFLKILFYPLVKKASVSMKKMQKLKPEMDALREKYKDDPKAQQQELMKFMGSHDVNPMKGCLPILPQIPVFFAFWRALSTSVDLRHAPFAGWITDLSEPDPFYVLPLLMGVLMFVQQKLTNNAAMDKMQQRIFMMFPVFFTVVSLGFPSGMALYMVINTAISIVQQFWLNKRLEVDVEGAGYGKVTTAGSN